MSEHSLQANIRCGIMVSPAAPVHAFSMGKQRRSAPVRAGRRGAYLTEEQLATYGTAGIKVRQWRFYRERMTIAELSEAADVAEGLISDLENEKGGCGLDTLEKLAPALKATIGMLFDVDPLRDKEFWSIYEEADPAQRRIIREQAAVIVRRV